MPPIADHWRFVGGNPEYVQGDWLYRRDPDSWDWDWEWQGSPPAPPVAPANAPPRPPGWGRWRRWPPSGTIAVGPSNIRRMEFMLAVILAFVLLLLILSATGAFFPQGGGYGAANPGALPTSTDLGGGGGGAETSPAAPATTPTTPAATPPATTPEAPATTPATTPEAPATTPNAPTTSAAPQTQDLDSNGPLGVSCGVTPTLPAHWAGWQNHPTANTFMSRQELWVTSHPPNGQPGAQLADYAGTEKVSADDMAAFVHDARCDGMASAIEVSPFVRNSDGLSLSQLISAVDGQSGLMAYVVGMNDLGTSCKNLTDVQCLAAQASAVGKVVGQVHGQSSKPVLCIIDKMTNAQAELFKNAGCARAIVGYYPWQESSIYGPVSALTEVGGLAQSVDGNAATAGIQTFSWWLDDQPDAAQLGFTAMTGGLPPVSEVHLMGALANGGGAHSLLAITLESSEDSFNRDSLCAAVLRFLVGT